MNNKTNRKMLELENEISLLKTKDVCECFMIRHLNERIAEYKGIESPSNYDPDFDYDAYYNSLKFLYEKEITLWNPFKGEFKSVVKFYECSDCGKPFCLEERVAYA